ncbi:hypothetical protein KY335_03900, partial [Candidatus Woesearchaeota archaeon]|nr:hypothetical protein [Candidatus Woesearchaeota archaeon]
DQTLKSALEERINFSQENVSATIFKVLEDMDFDNIIIKGAVLYFTSNNGKTENLYRLDLATNLLERLIVNTKIDKIQKVQSVYNPNMYGKYIVFNDLSGSPGPLRDAVKSKIIICDLESGKKDTVDRTENALFQPDIWGTNIIWKEGSDFVHTLYSYDILKKNREKIGYLMNPIKRPKIYKDIVVFESATATPVVSYYNLATGTEVAMPRESAFDSQESPSIYDKKIVFADDRNGNWDIYLFDLENEQLTQITNNTADQKNPMIYQDLIVWEDYRNQNSDIYLYYLEDETEIQISNSTDDEWSPSIFGGLVAWKSGTRKINENDLYVYIIPQLSYYQEIHNVSETNTSVTEII